MTARLTRDQMRRAGIEAGIPADVVDKMLGRGLVLQDGEPYRLMLRLVVDDGDTFHEPAEDVCPDCGRASCTGENCYWPDEAGLR